RNRAAYVMIPGYAGPAHRRMRAKMAQILEWNERSPLNKVYEGDSSLGIVTASVAFQHAREAAPDASVFKVGMSHPLPIHQIRAFAETVDRCLVVEEGDPYLVEQLRTEGIACEGKLDMYRFGELNITRVRRIIAGDGSPEPMAPRGKPPQLCVGCPHRMAFAVLKKHDCVIAGDIGCYTLSVLPPFETMDTCVCMGASISVGLGLRHALPDDKARRVVSVIGDSTFMHSGLTGLAEMVYNPPKTGHVVIILDNGTTAMTGMQEHPGTGRKLDHTWTNQVKVEEVARAMGVTNVAVVEHPPALEAAINDALSKDELSLIIMHRVCRLAEKRIKALEADREKCHDDK
ncbi:MAG TPA: thiamine pyrophosphate-dependent enzyme, partial [Candidatus Hydrogenedentes bacterium]|nr:thiamine pyrophosphate-dependent enzyme [Candidatus Hydrogenedentota bacterium]